MSHIIRSAGRVITKTLFPFWQRLGFHITRNHYYEPIPDTRELKDELWQKKSELVGIDMHEQDQLRLLAFFNSTYKKEYDLLPQQKEHEINPYDYYVFNGSFETVDGEILYCMIRSLKPKKIMEIGSGFSTFIAAKAIEENKKEDGSYRCELEAIEPYPNETLLKGFPNLTRLTQKKVQDVPLEKFQELGEHDILFIDSSHVLKIGSDVQYEILEILPRVRPGVVVHVHDIFLPAEYPKEWVMKEYRFWSEQYALQAFLAFNSAFEVLWGGNYMHMTHAAELKKAFPSYEKSAQRGAGSFWMRRKLAG